jgi:hypothetical protein
MKEESIRTTVDIPRPLYRKLKEQAAARGSSIRELVLAGIKSVLLPGRRPRRVRVAFPLIISEGPKVNVSYEDIYGHIESCRCQRLIGAIDKAPPSRKEREKGRAPAFARVKAWAGRVGLKVRRELRAFEQGPVSPAAECSADERGYPEHPQLL